MAPPVRCGLKNGSLNLFHTLWFTKYGPEEACFSLGGKNRGTWGNRLLSCSNGYGLSTCRCYSHMRMKGVGNLSSYCSINFGLIRRPEEPSKIQSMFLNGGTTLAYRADGSLNVYQRDTHFRPAGVASCEARNAP